jgi:hypothetical protein
MCILDPKYDKRVDPKIIIMTAIQSVLVIDVPKKLLEKIRLKINPDAPGYPNVPSGAYITGVMKYRDRIEPRDCERL